MKTLFEGIDEAKINEWVKLGVKKFLIEATFDQDQIGVVRAASESGIIIGLDMELMHATMGFHKKKWKFKVKIAGIGEDGGRDIITRHEMRTSNREHAVFWAADMAKTMRHLA